MTLADCQAPTQVLSHSSSPADQWGANQMEKIVVLITDREITHQSPSVAEQMTCGILIQFIPNLKNILKQDKEKQTKLKSLSLYPTLSTQVQLHSLFQNLPPLPHSTSSTGKMGSGSCGQFITFCLCQFFLFAVFPCSSTGSLPHNSVLHKLLQCPYVTAPIRKPAPCGLPSQTTALAKSLLLHDLFLSCNFPQDRSTFSGVGSSTGCRKTAMVSPQATGKSLFRCLKCLIISLFADFHVCRAFSYIFLTAVHSSFLILPHTSSPRSCHHA